MLTDLAAAFEACTGSAVSCPCGEHCNVPLAISRGQQPQLHRIIYSAWGALVAQYWGMLMAARRGLFGGRHRRGCPRRAAGTAVCLAGGVCEGSPEGAKSHKFLPVACRLQGG